MSSYYASVPICEIDLDTENPRIAHLVEKYQGDIPEPAIALALGAAGGDDGKATTYDSLKESIRVNGGIIQPIILQKMDDKKFKVIEGNTRVHIYKEFIENNYPGEWSTIPSIVYDEISIDAIHAIRLQAHLVGPRSWKPYAKAKYVHYLYNEKQLSIQQIISYCGGRANDINVMIKAYEDMETYYRPLLDSDDDFLEDKFSHFLILQERQVLRALRMNNYTKTDYAKWVVEKRLDTAKSAYDLQNIFKSKEATNEFFKTNASEARKCLHVIEAEGSIKDASLSLLADTLIQKIGIIPFNEIQSLCEDESVAYYSMCDLRDSLKLFLDMIDRQRESRD